MAKPEGKKFSNAGNGSRPSPRLQRKTAGPGLKPTKRTESKNSKSLKPAAQKTTCQVSKKKMKRAPTTFNLFIRHVANFSRSNNIFLSGTELMREAANCWKRLTPEQKMNFRNTNLPFKHKRKPTPTPEAGNDPEHKNQGGLVMEAAYP